MKTLSVILKILAALAAIAGVIYVVATYGDKIVAWAKSLLNRCGCCCGEGECCCEDGECCCGEGECCCEAAEEAPAAETAENVVEAEAADFAE